MLWSPSPPLCETAEYRGRKLRVRHLWLVKGSSNTDDHLGIGFVDSRMVGSARGPPHLICDLLFRTVDAEADGTVSGAAGHKQLDG